MMTSSSGLAESVVLPSVHADENGILIEQRGDKILGRFGHHANLARDFCIEVEVLQAAHQMLKSTGSAPNLATIGDTRAQWEAFDKRLSSALTRIFVDPDAVNAKYDLRKLAGQREDEIRLSCTVAALSSDLKRETK